MHADDSSPIDGTTNFASRFSACLRMIAESSLQIHGYPMVATSIGVTMGGTPVVGVVYNPFLKQLVGGIRSDPFEASHDYDCVVFGSQGTGSIFEYEDKAASDWQAETVAFTHWLHCRLHHNIQTMSCPH